MTKDGTKLASIQLTDPRQRITDQHIYNSTAAILSADQHRTRRLLAHLAHDNSATAALAGTQRGKRLLGVIRADDREKLAFIGNVQRVKPKQLAGAANFVADRDQLFLQYDAQTAIAGSFVKRSSDTSAGGVTHPANGRAT